MAKTARVDIDPIDGGLLATLDERDEEYGAVLAHEFGLKPEAVERRCDRLVSRGLVERITAEPFYGVTDVGRRYLARRSAATTSRVTE